MDTRTMRWIFSRGMPGMILAFSVASGLQTFIERVMDLGYMTAQVQMRFWFIIVTVLGVVLLGGVLLVDLPTLRPALLAEAGRGLAGKSLSCQDSLALLPAYGIVCPGWHDAEGGYRP